MAYGNIYYLGFQSLGVKGTLYIDKLDYSGSASKLKMIKDSLKISYKFDSWENPIIPLQCEFSLVNEKTDYFELLPLMMAEEREYKIRVVLSSPIAYTAFEGYLNCEPVSQKYLHRQIINFVASNFLMKLDNIHPVSIDTLQNRTFINVINEILLSTGSTFNIRVNCVIHAEGDTPDADQTLFNMNGFFTEVFWTDNVERNTSLEILTSILKTFNCYIYWWQGYWYIERYEDLWNESIDYVEYNSATTYTPSDAGTVINKTFTVEDLNDSAFTERTQTLRAEPGMNTVKITLNDQRFLNLINGALEMSHYTGTTFPVPNFRDILFLQTSFITWISAGKPKSDIVNSIHRNRETGAEVPIECGLYFSFKTTIISAEDQINIKFKCCYGGAGYTGLKDIDVYFTWYLQVLPNEDFIQQGTDVTSLNDCSISGVRYQSTKISGSSFDKATKSVEVSIDIPIGVLIDMRTADVKEGLFGDQSFVLFIGHETGYAIGVGDHFNDAWFGDIVVTVTGTDQPNVITGVTNTKYLDKLDISLDLYDVETLDYKNAILRGSVMQKRTERWGTTGGATEIVAKGICWSPSSSTPTLSDSYTEDGTGYGVFTSQMINLTKGTSYYYRAYATDALGTTVYGDVKTLTTIDLTVGTYWQGGLIGYIFESGDDGYVSGEIHGIIVRDRDEMAGVVWGRKTGGSPIGTTGRGEGIGDGAANTALMIANTYQNQFAISAIMALNDPTNENTEYHDWFLPSRDELASFHDNKYVLYFRDLGEFWYWSSSEYVVGTAWAVNFQHEVVVDWRTDMTTDRKFVDRWGINNYMSVRACRYF